MLLGLIWDLGFDLIVLLTFIGVTAVVYPANSVFAIAAVSDCSCLPALFLALYVFCLVSLLDFLT